MGSLTHTQSTLLLLLLIFEKEQALELLKYLPEDEAAFLGDRVRELMELPESQRLQKLINGIKTFLYQEAFSGLPFDDVGRLIEVLRRELPTTVGVILRYLPERVAAEVRRGLPPETVEEIPDAGSLERIAPDVVQGLRHEFQKVYFRELYSAAGTDAASAG
jgi:flagellar motor switch protein FliG